MDCTTAARPGGLYGLASARVRPARLARRPGPAIVREGCGRAHAQVTRNGPGPSLTQPDVSVPPGAGPTGSRLAFLVGPDGPGAARGPAPSPRAGPARTRCCSAGLARARGRTRGLIRVGLGPARDASCPPRRQTAAAFRGPVSPVTTSVPSSSSSGRGGGAEPTIKFGPPGPACAADRDPDRQPASSSTRRRPGGRRAPGAAVTDITKFNSTFSWQFRHVHAQVHCSRDSEK